MKIQLYNTLFSKNLVDVVLVRHELTNKEFISIFFEVLHNFGVFYFWRGASNPQSRGVAV